MGRKFSKRVTKKTKIQLSPKEAEEIYKKEFVDSRGNKMRFIFDFKPQSPKDPIIEWNREYNKE